MFNMILDMYPLKFAVSPKNMALFWDDGHISQYLKYFNSERSLRTLIKVFEVVFEVACKYVGNFFRVEI